MLKEELALYISSSLCISLLHFVYHLVFEMSFILKTILRHPDTFFSSFPRMFLFNPAAKVLVAKLIKFRNLQLLRLFNV